MELLRKPVDQDYIKSEGKPELLGKIKTHGMTKECIGLLSINEQEYIMKTKTNKSR